jgi:hypothetical protein
MKNVLWLFKLFKIYKSITLFHNITILKTIFSNIYFQSEIRVDYIMSLKIKTKIREKMF